MSIEEFLDKSDIYRDVKESLSNCKFPEDLLKVIKQYNVEFSNLTLQGLTKTIKNLENEEALINRERNNKMTIDGHPASVILSHPKGISGLRNLSKDLRERFRLLLE